MLYYRTVHANDAFDWVVFIHGAGGNSSLFFKQIKEFKKHFNLLLIDLHGHGKSKEKTRSHYLLEEVAHDVIAILEHLNIKKAHFLGVSLGTVIINAIYKVHPDRIISMVLGGAVVDFTFRSNTLIKIGNMLKRCLPYMWLYKVFAYALMPKSNHANSRNMFIREATILGQKEFIKWFSITNQVVHLFKSINTSISKPHVYIMGDEDHMFLPIVQKAASLNKNAQLIVLDECGHVCNVDKPTEFNAAALAFMNKSSSRD